MQPKVSDLMNEIRVVGDFEDEEAITPEFLAFAVNAELQELYDLAVAMFPDQFVIPTEINLETGKTIYDLPENCKESKKIYFIDSSGNYSTMERMQLDDMDVHRNTNTSFFLRSFGNAVPYYRIIGRKLYLLPPDAVLTGTKVQILYVPELQQLDINQDIPIQIPVGWKDFLVMGGISRCVAREEGDPSIWMMKKEEARRRIINAGTSMDRGKQPQVIDVYRRNLRLEP